MPTSFRESYLKLDKKQEALNAFKMPPKWHLMSIQEDASLNYAKLSYENGIVSNQNLFCLLGFTKKYPNNASRSVVEKLLIDSISPSKIIGSIGFIGKIKVLRIWRIKSYFYRGLELYADRDYAEALKMFKNRWAS
jgi:hypothetical protein